MEKDLDKSEVNIYAERPGEPVNKGNNEMSTPVDNKVEGEAEEKVEADKAKKASDMAKKTDSYSLESNSTRG